MRRRLGGFRRPGFPALASLSLVTALACGGAITGCGGDDNGGGGSTEEDAGDGGDGSATLHDAGKDGGQKDTGAPTPDAGPDSGTTVVDSGTTVEDSGPDSSVAADSGVDSGGQTGIVDSGAKDSGPDSTGTGPVDSGVVDSGHIVDSGGGSNHDAGDATAGPVASFSTTAFSLPAGNCGGAAVSAQYAITNTGGSTLNVTNVQVTGSVFAVTPATLSIAAGQTGHLTVSATVPQNSAAGATLSTNLTFATNDPAHPTGSVAANVGANGVTLAWANGSATSADFGLQPEGAAATPKTLTLTNSGNASVTVGFGTVSAPFSLSPASSGALAPGGSVQLTAGFDPMDTQQRSVTSTFSLPSGTAVCGTSVSSLALSGQGGSGTITGWPGATVDFGLTNCGAAPTETSFVLSNSGTLDAHITSATVSGTTSFSTDAIVGSTIPAGGSLTVHLDGPPIPSAPASISTVYSGTISFTTDAFDDTAAHVVTLNEEPQGAILSFDTLQNNNFGNFGAVAAGTPTPQSFNVVNSGNAAALVQLAVTGDTNNAFPLSTPLFTVGGGTPQGETITFDPPSFGSFGGTLNMSTGAALCAPIPAGIPVAGSGNAGTIAVSTQSIPFATPCGTTAPPQTFTVTNNGNEPINWSASLAGGAGSPYTISVGTANGGSTSGDGTAVGNTALNPGAIDTITVQPKPVDQFPANTSPSAFADTITVTTTNVPGDNPHTIALSETPLGDIIQWTATSFPFGNQPVGTSSTPQTFTITNAANPGSPSATVGISLGGDSPADFSLSAPTATLAAGATSSPISVDFNAPATANPYGATVTLGSGDILCAQLPGPVTASGTAVVAGPEYSQTSLAFGNVNCGTAAGPQTITVSNTGGNPFNITGLTLTTGTYFTVTSNPPLPANVPANTSNAVTITLTPNPIPATVPSVPDNGTYSDSLLITTDANIASPNQTVPLQMGAQGVIIANALVSTNWNFGTVPFGSTGNYNIPINNTGNESAFATLTTTQTNDYALASPIIPPGNGLLTATFTPPNQSGTFPDTGTLTITPSEGQVFCQPLPSSWGPPVGVTLTGQENNASLTSVSPTSLPFPAATCGSAPPAGEPVTIFNSANAGLNFTAQLLNGTYYTLSTTAGTVPANGSTAIIVTPGNQLNLAQNGGGNTGSAPYSDTLEIQITTGTPTTYFVPITMTVNGVVLALIPEAGNGQVNGYNAGTCASTNNFTVQASTGTAGAGATIQNTGNVAGTVETIVVAPQPGFGFGILPAVTNINAGAQATFQMFANSSDNTCVLGTPVFEQLQLNAQNMCAAPLMITFGAEFE